MNVSDALLNSTKPFYTENDRYYHNWNHICEGFDNDHPLQLSLHQKLAWLCHDLVYIPGALPGVNEKLSVFHSVPLLSAAKSVAVSTEEDPLQRVQYPIKDLPVAFDYQLFTKIIMSTVEHMPLCVEANEVLDLDLQRFAYPFDVFSKHCDEVRKEYQHIDDETYNTTRIKLLESFMHRDTIYYTDYARTHWEKRARINITQHINTLKHK